MTSITELKGSRVLLDILIIRKQGAGIIAIPPDWQLKSYQAIVRMLGDNYTGPIRVGDKVIFERAGLQELKFPEETLYLTNEEHILAIIEDEAKDER